MPFPEGKVEQGAKEAEGCWGEAYPVIVNLVVKNNMKIGAEIGVAYGGLCESVLTNTNVEKMYGIDPYLCKYSCAVQFQLTQDELDKLYDFLLTRLARFGAKYQHIREPSNKAAKYVSEKLDFVYIDADHSYLGVLEDLCVWFPKIRNNGFLSGHDYKHPNWPGVAKAVDRFFGMLGLQVNNQGYVWWAQKRQTRMESIFLRLTSIYVRLYKAMHIEFIASKLKFICLRVYFICQMVYKKVRRN